MSDAGPIGDGRVDEYRRALSSIPEADLAEYLAANSHLPGPRGNLELAAAFADESRGREWLLQHASIGPDVAPENTPESFVTFCAVVALGDLVAEGDRTAWRLLRERASDSRWRIREAVAMALQRAGDRDMGRLLDLADELASDGLLEKRAAVAAICEPRLLSQEYSRAVIEILGRVTASIAAGAERKADGFRTLRQAMGYCWSVAIEAYPHEGKHAFESWLSSRDRDVRWLLKENLKKKRLLRRDAAWVQECLERLQQTDAPRSA